MDEQATERSPDRDPPKLDGERTASLLRRRAAASELWVALEGTSMEPTLTAPAEVLIRAGERPRWGEVWAFVRPSGELTVHRVLHRRRNGAWVMRGDGAPRTDPPVPIDRLVGRAVAVRSHPAATTADCAGPVTHPLPVSRVMSLRLQLRRIKGLLR